MKAPLKQIVLVLAFVGLTVLLYFAPRGYPGVKNKKGGQEATSQVTIESQIAEVKKELGPDKVKKVDLFEKQLATATTTPARAAALDSLIKEWDKLMRPLLAAHYSFEKSELLNTFAAWFETGNRFYFVAGVLPKENQVVIYQQAADAYTKALALQPNDKVARTRYAICEVFSSQGTSMPKGITDLRKLVEEDSTNIEAQTGLGMFGLQSGQYDKAEKRFRTVIAIDPNDKMGYWYLAGALEAQNKNADAVKYLKAYIAHNTDTAENKEVEKYINELINKK